MQCGLKLDYVRNILDIPVFIHKLPFTGVLKSEGYGIPIQKMRVAA